MQVARYVAAELTNRQIGQRMLPTSGTVKIHLSHIFTKLRFPSRVHLAVEATKRQLDRNKAQKSIWELRA